MQIDCIKDDLRLVINDHKVQTRSAVDAILKVHQNRLEQDVTSAFLEAYPEWEGNLYKKSRRYEQWMKDILTQKLLTMAASEQSQMNKIVEKAKRHAQRYAKSFRERLNDNIETVLGVTMAKEDWPIQIQPLRQPDISIGKAFDIPLDLLWFLFPMFLFRNLFKRYFQSHIEREVEKNIQRLISDFTEMIYAEMTRIQERTFGYIRDEIVSITNLLSARERHDSVDYQIIIEKIAGHYNIPLI